MKYVKKAGAGLLTTVLLSVLCAVQAMALELVPVGRAVGIWMNIDGVLVVGLAPLDTESGSASPAGEAGIMPGDRIVRLGANTIRGGDDFLKASEALSGSPVSLTVRRGDKTIQFTVTPVLGEEGIWKLGLWLRDSVAGIGTVTFYDPATGLFGALGHGVADADTGVLMPLSKGSITGAEVLDVLPGSKGTPGELCGSLDAAAILGEISQNTVFGIFGRTKAAISDQGALPVADESELSLGKATILSTVSGNKVREFRVEITRVYRGEDSGRCLMLTVTDPELLAVTGGIVQGMSGSPILQNGKFVGAVTHVLVNDPTRGYGISLERMLTASEMAETEAPAA
jgi:stage IV sporulation protein B